MKLAISLNFKKIYPSLLRVGEQLWAVIYAGTMPHDDLEIGINRNIVMALVFSFCYPVMAVAFHHSIINKNEKGEADCD